MSDLNVVEIQPGIREVAVDELLEGAKGKFAEVIVLGVTADGGHRLIRSDGFSRAADAYFALANAQLAILNGDLKPVE